MTLGHFLNTISDAFLLIIIMSAPRTALNLQNQCQEDFDLDLIENDEDIHGQFEFTCVGCCNYNGTIHKNFIEEAIDQFINMEFTCQGSSEEGDVLYVSLDTWIEGPECSGRRLRGHGGAFSQHQRHLASSGGLNYFACKNCNKKKQKRRKIHLDW